jgi:AraC family transcriptional regulator
MPLLDATKKRITPDSEAPEKNRREVLDIRRLETFIDHHLEGPITLHMLAREAGFSDFYFSRLFRTATGIAPLKLVGRRRIERAKLLLTESSASLAEIALSCGWSDQSYFTTAFRRAVGVTPRQFRRNNRQPSGA